MNSTDKRALWIGGGVCVVGGIIIALTQFTAICNAQAEGLVLALTAGVAAAYAYLTREQARATEKAARASAQALNLAYSSELFAWRVRDDDDPEHGRFSVYRLHNAGKGAALNVVVHPMWDEWCDKGNYTIEEAIGQEEHEEFPARPHNRTWRMPIMPHESFGHFATLEHSDEEEEAILCVRWDDQSKGRRWRCWRIVNRGPRPDNEALPDLQRSRYQPTTPDCPKWQECPERKAFGECPHVIRQSEDGAAEFRERAEKLYGSED